jgi:hypothetical protein
MKIIQNDNFNAGTVHLISSTPQMNTMQPTPRTLHIGFVCPDLDQAIKFTATFCFYVIMEPTVIIEDDSDIGQMLGRFWQG